MAYLFHHQYTRPRTRPWSHRHRHHSAAAHHSVQPPPPVSLRDIQTHPLPYCDKLVRHNCQLHLPPPHPDPRHPHHRPDTSQRSRWCRRRKPGAHCHPPTASGPAAPCCGSPHHGGPERPQGDLQSSAPHTRPLRMHCWNTAAAHAEARAGHTAGMRHYTLPRHAAGMARCAPAAVSPQLLRGVRC